MPIVTLTVRKPKSREFKTMLLSVVHDALCHVGVDPRDRFQRVIELDEDSFVYDPHFPDLPAPRTSDFVLVEILLGAGRSVKIKRAIVARVVEGLTSNGFDPENLMLVFQDVPWENWSPGGGRMPHA